MTTKEGCTKEGGMEHPIPSPAILREGPGPIRAGPAGHWGSVVTPTQFCLQGNSGLLSTQNVSLLRQQHGTIEGTLKAVAEAAIPRYLWDPCPRVCEACPLMQTGRKSISEMGL